uniref:(California timema) hypothetical protein n=1 Tax=Timema californicum TaxID=61474 RepID=A0A7R9JD35_TIMCA|nr:unnamed protein product [Timema californicum]
MGRTMECCDGVEIINEDEDSNVDKVTQMLPEYFVSVKLENNEVEGCYDKINCSTLSSGNSSVDVSPHESLSQTELFNMSERVASSTTTAAMQSNNSQSHSVHSNHTPHCFHPSRGPSIPDLPPWLPHCYAGQLTSDCTQTSQHFLPQAAYLGHDASQVDSSPVASLVLTDSSQLTSDNQHLGIYSSPVASLVLTDSSQLTSDSQHLGIYSSPVASLVLTDSSQLTSDSQHLGIYSSPVASLVLTDSSQLTSDSQHLGIYSSPVASLVLTDSSQLTSDSQHLGIYSSPVASLVLTDSSQLTSDSQHLGIHLNFDSAVSCQLSKSAGSRAENPGPSSGIGSLANGDICDSNMFLNYVLNQQRSSGLFLFDAAARSLHSSDTLHHDSSGCEGSSDVGGAESVNKSLNDSLGSARASHPPMNSTKVANLADDKNSPTHRDVATNTVCKFTPAPQHDQAGNREGEPDGASLCSETNAHHCKCTHKCSERSSHEQENIKSENVRNFCCKCQDGTTAKPVSVSLGNCGKSAVYHSQEESDHDRALCHSVFCTQCSLNEAQQGCNKFPSKCVGYCDSPNSQRVPYVDVDRPFTCEICLKNYPTSSALANHVRYHRGDRPYQCEICCKAFATNSHLVTHRRTHTGERPYQCSLCRRSFADRSAFVKHERTHGPDGVIIKRYKCEECGSTFVDSCGLKKHIRIHTGERPYHCSVCDKSFSTSSTFVAHKRIHSGERPHHCEQCSKAFVTKSHLLTHRRTHTGEKPFTCQACHRAFADGSSFRRHERLHTGENRHTCDVCGKGFPFETSLAKHKQSHVPGTPTYVYMV